MISAKNQEELSKSYFCAIASMIDAITNPRNRDEDGVDLCVSKEMAPSDSQSLLNVDVGFQLKSANSTNHYKINKNKDIIYALKVKNYNDLVKPTMTPRLLALLLLPERIEEWVNLDSEKMTIKKCMYFVSLKGMPPSNNKNTVNIVIPKENLLTFESLTDILQKVADGREM